ncbi:hypothetical protein EG328_010096 [Venturia inaequalis]|uniref:Uncharacterized protein n=1 Tax=Venturia inaequalis TaxID=5025 RepID=A0A8H3V8W5_VENIN|nr:hypothetical protein EG328_010096 [Venturia inaequalis]
MEPDRSTSGPPLKKFHATELSSHVTAIERVRPQNPKNGKPSAQTKTFDKPIDLRECRLFEMTQYNCPEPPMVKRGEKPHEILCTPLQRLFRKCAGGLTVETTEWEGMPKQ